MNHIDFDMGVYYPIGGVYTIIESLRVLAESYGATIHTNSPVKSIETNKRHATGVILEDGSKHDADIIVSNADMWFTETKLLPKSAQTYPQRYWDKKTMGPSACILYFGLNTKIPNLLHHTLRFATNWQENFADIFDNPKLPEDPSYYLCCPTKTDTSIAPEGHDILYVLVPLAADLDLSPSDQKEFRDKIVAMIADDIDFPDLENHITYEGEYWNEDFKEDYNAFQGTALGLAHTLKQTLLRPKNTSKKLDNFYYVGAGTNPGIGMPICLISAELAYKRIEGIHHPHPLDSLDG